MLKGFVPEGGGGEGIAGEEESFTLY